MDNVEFRDIRKRAGLTQVELASHLGISQAAIARYESDPSKGYHRNIPSDAADRLRKLAKEDHDAA